MDIQELARRVAVLEEIEAIRKLKANYAALCDTGYDPDQLTALFTEDAVWDGGKEWGRYEGRAALWDFFKGASTMLPFALHYMTNPLIEVDGDTATGTWHLFQTTTYAATGDAIFGGARYYEDYVKQDGAWKFRHVRMVSSFWTPYESGWVKRPFVQEPAR
jgi:ketosteroid isomerase-like protein